MTQRTGGGDRAAGVELADGAVEPAEVVISAADGHATVYDMLGGAYLDEQLRDVYERDTLPLFSPILFVGVGVAPRLRRRAAADLRTAPHPGRADRRRERGHRPARGTHQQLRPGARAGGQDGDHLGDRGRRPVLDRAARARPRAVQGGEGAHRRSCRARPRPPLPGPQGPGRDGRRGHAGDHRPLHRQLARELRGLPADARAPDEGPAAPAARPRRLLHGRPVGRSPAAGCRPA